MGSVGHHVFGLAGPVVGVADHLVPGGEPGYSGAGLRDDPGQVAALPGQVAGQRACIRPLRIFASPGLMPAAFTWTSTWPGPGSGRGTSTTLSTSTPPYSSKRTAFGMTPSVLQARLLPWRPLPTTCRARLCRAREGEAAKS